MEKKEILENLRDAKDSHVKWVKRARMLIHGIHLDKDAIPLNATECKFGKWLYTYAKSLSALPNNISENIKKIEEFHFDLHKQYAKIFNIYFSDTEKGFFAKLFHIKKKISPDEQSIAQKCYEKIEEISQKLLNEIEKLERRIIVVPEKEIKKLA